MTLDADGEIEAAVSRILARLGPIAGPLLPLLHAYQHEFGCVPATAVPAIARALNLSRAEVHGVISFYPDFRDRPAGRHVVKLCRAEACQARGGTVIEQALADRLDVAMNATRPDGQVTLEAVYCLGLCATGPNALIDGAPLSRIDVTAVERIAERIAS